MGNTNEHHRHAVAGGRRTPVCDRCSTGLVEIELLIDDQPLVMRSCSECDTRSWHRRGGPAELGDILTDLSSVPKRYRRDLSTSR